MDTLTLGFVGGCLTHQAGIPHPRLFHRLVGRRLEDERGVRLRLAISKEYAAEPGARVADLLHDERPDVVLLHRSMNVFLTKPMAVFVADGGRYIVNPFLFRRRQARSWLDHEHAQFHHCPAIWPPRRLFAGATAPTRRPNEGDDAPEIPQSRLASTQAAAVNRGFRLRDLAWVAGHWAGLDAWAIDDELRIVAESRAACVDAGVPLLVLGPGLRIGVAQAQQFAARIDATLDRWARSTGDVGYISLLAESPDCRSPHPVGVGHYRNHVHFNVAGHEHVAARLWPHLDRLLDLALRRYPRPNR